MIDILIDEGSETDEDEEEEKGETLHNKVN